MKTFQEFLSTFRAYFFNRVLNRFFNRKQALVLISDKIRENKDTYCSGIYLSARWMMLNEAVDKGIQFIILPSREAAEYCAADLYNIVEGDCVFFLPDSGKSVERSNYKSSLVVQKTSAIGSILNNKGEKLFIVTYPEAAEELIPEVEKLSSALFTIRKGEEYSYASLRSTLLEKGFEKVDFVSAPGQFAIRGTVIDVFSYSLEKPYRIAFFGDEVDKINTFDCNTQLSIEEIDRADIYPDIAVKTDTSSGVSIFSILPPETVVWLDSSDMYKDSPYSTRILNFLFPISGKRRKTDMRYIYMEKRRISLNASAPLCFRRKTPFFRNS